MNNSSTKYMRIINFSKRLCFLPVNSHIRKWTKMRFLGNPPKVVQLQNYIKSWIMVVQGWYMTHINRKDILNTKKLCLGGFRNLSDLQRSNPVFLGFFREILVDVQNPKKIECLDFRVRKFCSKIIFMQINLNPWKLNT